MFTLLLVRPRVSDQATSCSPAAMLLEVGSLLVATFLSEVGRVHFRVATYHLALLLMLEKLGQFLS
jgi:hypothetical protein